MNEVLLFFFFFDKMRFYYLHLNFGVSPGRGHEIAMDQSRQLIFADSRKYICCIPW